MSKPIRCAIYTRKSSEEGLEQDFNSLHAQREACEAYITSQKHEGWKLLPQAYDDGGISGGTMQRPALQRLLKAVEDRTVDISSSSTRLGKLFDAEMRRFVGSHTIKKARRYRFYISESLRREADPTGWRLPAAIIEDKVGELIRLTLKDGVTITRAAYGAGIDPAYIKGLIAQASDAASKWSLGKLVQDVFMQVQIQMDQICLELNLDTLLPKVALQDGTVITIRRQFPVVLKRRGVEMRLVMRPTDYRAPKIDQQIVSTIAKGHVWFDDWLHGQIKGYKDIVEREDISASYAGDVMKLAFLSPTLVEDIIYGRQPDGLMVSHLTKVEDMPLRWEDQAAQYGWT